MWQTATNDIKPLREQVEKYLSEIDWVEWESESVVFSEIDSTQYQNAIQTAKKMKAKGFSIEDIIEITGLSVLEINKI